MSRSFKKAIVTISKKVTKFSHRALRKKVKSKLRQIDPEDVDGPDLIDIEADTRDAGLEEWGTKMGMEFCDIEELDPPNKEDWYEEKRRERRK